MEHLYTYLIAVNIIGFLLFTLSTRIRSDGGNKPLNAILTALAALGASPGIVIGIAVLDIRAKKGNMMLRVFALSMLVIQTVIFLVYKGFVTGDINYNFWTFLKEHRPLLIYLIVINTVTFAAFLTDKIKAVKDRSRIRISTLLALSFAGGSLGGMAAMYLFRHKIRKDYFYLGEPLILVMQVIVLLYFMNMKLPL